MPIIIGKTKRHAELIDVSTPHKPQDIDTSLPYNFSNTASTFAGRITSQFIGTATSTLYGDGSQLTGLPSGGGGGIGGSGTINYIPIWTGNTQLGTSLMLQSGGSINADCNLHARSLSTYINVSTLTNNTTTLIPGVHAMYQFLSTGGGNRNIYLSTNAKPGDRFVIKNVDIASDSFNIISVYQGASSIDILYKDKVGEYVFDGTNWRGGLFGYTSFDSQSNISIGLGANGYNNGVAVGYNARGYNNGVAVGYNSDGNYHGVAVGRDAIGYSLGVAVGRDAIGNSFGVAVGYNTIGNNSGIAIGYYTRGYNANLSIGYYAGYILSSGSYNIIIGYQAGSTSGSSPATGSYNIIIGCNAWTPSTATSNFLNLGSLIFATGIGSTAGSIAMGNVGIRTISPNSALHVDGAIALGVIVTNVSSTLDDRRSIILVDASSSSITLTLPNANTCSGRLYWIKKIDSSSNSVLLTTQAGQLIDGSSSIQINTANQCYLVTSSGANWYVLSRYL